MSKKGISSSYGPKCDLQSPESVESATRDILKRVFSTVDDEPIEINWKSDNLDELNDAINDVTKPQHEQKQQKCENKYFIEIGTFGCGSIFGLGEQMDDRIITAGNKGVQCLLIPRYWLMQKKQNSGNIWQRLIFINVLLTTFLIGIFNFELICLCQQNSNLLGL